MPRSRQRHRSSAIVLLISACVWSCSVLAPQSDVSRFYTLSAVGSDGDRADQAPRHLTYGLGPIELPSYLDRTELATRVSAAEVAYSQTDYWAESMRANLARALQQDLSARLGGDRIVVYPWPRTVAVRYQVIVAVSEFERTAAHGTALRVRWTIRDLRTHTDVASTDAAFTRAPAAHTTAAAVDALSADVGDLSEEIVSALRNLN